jgi:type I restriction enzyme, S subunit
MSLRYVKIEDVAETSSGGTPDRGNKKFYGGTIPWIKSGELPDGEIVDVEERITEDAIKYSSAKIINSGTLLMAMYGATVGKLGVLTSPAATNQAVCAIQPRESLDRDYLFYYLLKIRSKLIEKSFGGAQPNISQDTIKNIEVPLPSLIDQQVIASQLKQQFAEIEKAREAIAIQKKEVKRFKTLIREEVFIEIIEKYGRTHSLKEVCAISAGGTPSRGNTSFFSGNIPWVKTLDLNFGIVTDTQEKISKEALKSIRGKMLPKGTVLVAMYGGAGTIGKSGILGIEACTNQAICAMQPDASLLNYNYLHEWLCYIRPEWMQYSSGNRKDPNINKAVVEAMTIPLPPLKAQEAFAHTIWKAQSGAIELEAAILKQSQEIASLPKKLLEDAFKEIEND